MSRRMHTVHLASNGDYRRAWWYDSDGRRRSRGLGHKSKQSKAAALAECRQLQEQFDRCPGLVDAGSVPELGAFLADATPRLIAISPSSRRQSVKDAAASLLAFYGADSTIDRIDTPSAWRWLLALLCRELEPARTATTGERWVDSKTAELYASAAADLFHDALLGGVMAINPFGPIVGAGLRDILARAGDERQATPEPIDDYRPADWFASRARSLNADRLRKAFHARRIVGHKQSGRWAYSIQSVAAAYPDHREAIESEN